MRSTLVITLCVLVTNACSSEDERSDDRAGATPSSSVTPRAPSRGAAELVLAEAEILARAGMSFQRRWLDWHFAGRPTNDAYIGRTEGVDGYQATGFDPSRLSDADRTALDRARASIDALPRGELRARYDQLAVRHGNAPFDASRTGSLRITDDGRHLVFADAKDPDIAYAWRITDGGRVARIVMRVSEDQFMTREALPSGLVWSQFTPTPAGRFLRVWDLPAEEPRWVHLVGDDLALAVSSDGRLAAAISRRRVVLRRIPSFRPIATLRGIDGDALVRRITGTDDVIGEWEEKSVNGRAAFSGDGKHLALFSLAGGTGRLHLFRVAGGTRVRELAVSLGDLSHLEVDRTGRRVVGYAPGRSAFAVWDDNKGERVVDAGAPVDQVALSADGAIVLVARGRRLELLDLASGAARWTVALSAPPRSLALSAPAGLVAWWSDSELAVADLATGERRPSFAGHTSWPDEATHREALALATILEDPDPPMYEAGLRDPLREADALDADLTPAYLGSLPRAQLALLPDLVEAHRGKPLASGPAAAIVRAWSEGCDGWYGKAHPDYSPDDLEPVDRRNLDAIHREIARRGAASPEATPAASGLAVGPRPCR